MYDKYKKLNESDSIDYENVPNNIISVPIIIIDNGVTYDGKIDYGFFGFRQDVNNLFVKPVKGFKIYDLGPINNKVGQSVPKNKEVKKNRMEKLVDEKKKLILGIRKNNSISKPVIINGTLKPLKIKLKKK